jgi:aryl-alcohol dehydrogenase-like predicted oxidoreductase
MLDQFVLGTAQLGMNYGRVNRTGQPSKRDAIAIVRRAVEAGIPAIDTARAYGSCESVIGEALQQAPRARVKVITKLDLAGLDRNASESEIRKSVDRSIEDSRRALRSDVLETVLLHNWSQYELSSGAVRRRLMEHSREGRVRSFGVSVYQPHEAMAALLDSELAHLQIPMNVLDWRWRPLVQQILKRRNLAVYSRGALLQGILANPAECWPQVPGFDNVECNRMLRAFAVRFGRESVADLCFAYVRSQRWVTSVVVGCETLPQLEENLHLFLTPPLAGHEVQELNNSLPRAPESLLNPAEWPAKTATRTAYAS